MTVNKLRLPLRTAVLVAALASCSGPPEERGDTRSAVSHPNSSAFSPYFYVDDRTEAAIEVKNLAASTLTLEPRVTLASGQLVLLEEVSVGPRATASIDLRAALGEHISEGGKSEPRWGDGSRSRSLTGSIELAIRSPQMVGAESVLSAWVFIKNRDEGLGLVSMFMSVTPPSSPAVALDGIWWRPQPETQVYYALQNASSEIAEVTMTVYAEGRAQSTTVHRLEAGGSRLINLGDHLGGTSANVGGIRFEYLASSEGYEQLGVGGMMVNEAARQVSPLGLFKTQRGSAGRPITLQSPLVIFGRMSGLVETAETILSPHLLLRNTTDQPLLVERTVHGTDRGGTPRAFPLAALTLNAHETVAFDLSDERRGALSDLTDGLAGLEVRHDGDVTALVAEVINLGDEIALYDRVVNLEQHHATAQAATSFNLSASHQTLIVLRNVTDSAQRAEVLIDHSEGRETYVLTTRIAPQQSATIDIAALRDQRIPDDAGNVLPLETTYGGARILSEPGAIIGSDPTIVYKDVDNRHADLVVSCLGHIGPGADVGGGGSGTPNLCRAEVVGLPLPHTQSSSAAAFPGRSFLTETQLVRSGLDIDAMSFGEVWTDAGVLLGGVFQIATVSCDTTCRPKITCFPWPSCLPVYKTIPMANGPAFGELELDHWQQPLLFGSARDMQPRYTLTVVGAAVEHLFPRTYRFYCSVP